MASVPQPLTFLMLEQELGVDYMAPFLTAAAGDRARAVRLHTWNSNVGAAFHRPLEWVEVAIRNRSDAALTTEFGPHWWHAPLFRAQATHVTLDALANAVARAASKGREAHADVITEITLGTWVAILRPRFFDVFWRHHHRTVFPNHRRLSFSSISQTADRILRLRNAIGHHEPLLAYDLAALHQDAIDVLGWMSVPMQNQALGMTFVPKVLAARP